MCMVMFVLHYQAKEECTDPESFARGGPSLIIVLVDEWCFADGWCSNIECWLDSLVMFQKICTSIAKEPYSL